MSEFTSLAKLELYAWTDREIGAADLEMMAKIGEISIPVKDFVRRSSRECRWPFAIHLGNHLPIENLSEQLSTAADVLAQCSGPIEYLRSEWFILWLIVSDLGTSRTFEVDPQTMVRFADLNISLRFDLQ